MPKAQRQEKSVVSQPPKSGPTATMPPMVEPHTAKAIPRSLPWKLALTSERVVGSTMAPPTPWSTRERMSRSPVGANAAMTDATPKITRPNTNNRRRPKRSDSAPKTKISAAKTSVYDSCTHCT